MTVRDQMDAERTAMGNSGEIEFVSGTNHHGLVTVIYDHTSDPISNLDGRRLRQRRAAIAPADDAQGGGATIVISTEFIA